MDKRTEKVIEDIANFHISEGVSVDDIKEILEAFLDALECDHDCTSNCRREGCNCACGEWHISEYS